MPSICEVAVEKLLCSRDLHAERDKALEMGAGCGVASVAGGGGGVDAGGGGDIDQRQMG